MNELSIDTLISGFNSNDKLVLSKAISLAESSKREHLELLYNFFDHYLSENQASIIGVSGPPGVGKSTFLDSFISYFLKDKESQVAVLTIDPSSEVSGGSILGDKTRMEKISKLENVFIRPSASQDFLGGVGLSTPEAIKLCELFGFEYIFVESVGVGQSEQLISHLVDCFVLLVNPAGGDELQGIKRGILEMVDVLLVGKSDGELEEKAFQTFTQFQTDLRLVSKKDVQKCLEISSMSEKGFGDLNQSLEAHFKDFNRIDNEKIFSSILFDKLSHFKSSQIKESTEFNKVVDQFSKDSKFLALLNKVSQII